MFNTCLSIDDNNHKLNMIKSCILNYDYYDL